MTCEDSARLLPAYSDAELDLVHTLEVEDHLGACPACAATVKGDRDLRAALNHSSLRYSAPANLAQRVRADIRKAMPEVSRERAGGWQWRWAAATAALALCAVLAWKFIPSQRTPAPTALADEAIAEHIRSLMPGHLSDIESTDQHNVKPWFDGRLDFSPPVENFAAQGFPLLGGRLDYLDHRPAAALVYGRRKHIINVFVISAPGESERAETRAASQGYNAFSWTRGGMNFWAVSDLNTAELGEFTRLLRGEGISPAAH
ncbi:MAG: anti-sigma factor [Candidatus Acidiferrales bacterium]